ncbi:tryptophan-rich sensory protein [Mycolicibacterium cyprinidarum]|uniref:Tryptophan-rich sensory protein n=1 Tax=Mycolicibacterium cyprinidarum TaxID=2860311 RepID=A0ABQ4VCQ8_9MYCO|nr:tryptophan-rich sensory protein [Mycolicibacterium sp. NGTWS0302]GJF18644.1 tryptophan-rich sensory protein [Mycolicibacterium sp. NGTWS1803]GJF19369.1 tryptophan-rich sensory protein [Mycolicibacterium sp. NGTWSNA01]
MRPSTLAKTAGAAFVTAALGGLASRPAQSRWYERLKKPGFQPPRQAFPIVWPILYTDIAVVSASTMDTLNERGETEKARAYAGALAANLVLNASWSWVFFNQRRLGAAAVVATGLTVSSVDLARRVATVNVPAGAALAPYPLWCAFATALSTRIWQLNR